MQNQAIEQSLTALLESISMDTLLHLTVDNLLYLMDNGIGKSLNTSISIYTSVYPAII